MSRFRVALSKPDGTPAFPTFDPGPFEDDPDVAIFHGRTIDNVEACTDNAIAVAITPDDVRRPVAVSVLTFILALAGKLIVKDCLSHAGSDGWAQRSDHIGVE